MQIDELAILEENEDYKLTKCKVTYPSSWTEVFVLAAKEAKDGAEEPKSRYFIYESMARAAFKYAALHVDPFTTSLSVTNGLSKEQYAIIAEVAVPK